MTVDEALIARTVSSPLATRLAAWSGTRAVHWDARPQGAGLPAIVFTMIDDGIDYTHSGRDRLRIVQIQADTLAETYGDARRLSDDLGRLLEGAADVGDITFTHGFVDRAWNVPVRDVAGAPEIFGRAQRLSIYCRE